jgi:amino acid adenylation domain-containing protein
MQPADRALRPVEFVHQLVARNADEHPDRVAVACGDSVITYRTLDGVTNRLARMLRQHGAASEIPVVLYLDRSPEAVVAMLAVLKAGGACVPIDPAYPAERIKSMMALVDPQLIITRRDLQRQLPSPGCPQIMLDEAGLGAAAHLGPMSGQPLAPENLAYVLFTSGSTGAPKAVLLDHHNLAQMVTAQRSVFPHGPGAHVLEFASFSFDGSVWELFLALCAGRTACIHSRAGGFDRDALVEQMNRYRVETAVLPPSVLQMLDPAELPDVRTIFSAGESCPPALATRWSGGRSFLNLYGTTETAAVNVVGDLSALPPGQPPHEVVPLGRPLPGSEITLLDEGMSPVPPGAVGYVGITGNVARGYAHAPAMTAERFVPSTCGGPGDRMYLTGDRARFGAAGELEFRGRTDNQVKVNGFRVELEEIEAALLGHPAVCQAAVVVTGSGTENRTLTAFITTDHPAVEPEELIAHAARILPPHMVPTSVTVLAEMPLSPNRKIDRSALAARQESRGTGERVNSRTAVEDVVAEAWAEALQHEAFGTSDNFFRLGGNSLGATTVIARLREWFGVRIPVSMVFEHPTVAGLSTALADFAGPAWAEQRAKALLSIMEPE